MPMTIYQLLAAIKVERLQFKKFKEDQEELRIQLKQAKHWEIVKLKEELAMLAIGVEGQFTMVEALQEMIEEHPDYKAK